MASYHKRKTKKCELWDCRFRVVEDGNFVNKRLCGFKRKSDAETAYRDYMASYESKPETQRVADNSLTFVDLYSSFIEYKKTRVKGSTLISLNTLFNGYILPAFGNKVVDKITKQDILKFQNELETNPDKLSFNYKTKIRQTLSALFNYGIMYFDIKKNPVKLVENFKNMEAPAEMQVWTLDEFITFASVIDNLKYKAYFSLLYLTGCRKNEATPLLWDDIDLVNNTINFNKTYTRKTDNGSFEITLPKSLSSIRKIGIPQNLAKMLIEFKSVASENYYVFGTDTPPTESPIQRAFERYIKRSELHAIRIHDLRHSHASYLISTGATIVAVAKRLGHSDIEQTLNTYAHFFKEDESKILDTLEFDFK